MLDLRKISVGVNRCLYGAAFGAFLLFSNQSVANAAGETSTSMTVITVDEWRNNSPSAHSRYTVDTIMLDAEYAPGHMSWHTSPYPRRWGQTLPNGVTGNLWAIKSFNGGATFSAISWDYIGNATSSKHLGSTPTGVIFTMVSSLCDQGGSGCATPQRVRSSVVRWPKLIPSGGTMRIEPPEVGVFVTQGTQRFKAYDGDRELKASDVDWWISEAPAGSQGLKPEQIATIDENGVATILSSKGTVKVSACYPRGCGPNKAVNTGANLLLLR